MEQLTLNVNLGERSYPIEIGESVTELLVARIASCRGSNRPVAVITDENVRSALSALFDGPLSDLPVIVFPAGEETKCLDCLGQTYDFLAAQKIDRSGVVLAVGGGVIGDLAGFAAASFLRGLDFYQVPTTLLAMVDSSVGGKTGINIGAGKNLVGAFHQPRAVFIGTEVLGTLPPREFAAGMAEVIKSGLLADRALFERLRDKPVAGCGDARLPGVIRRCCEIKAEVVQSDERETAASGGRALLNLGHTFAHAIEKVAGYGHYLHGEAVGIGLAAAARLSEELNLISADEARSVVSTVEAHRLPVRLQSSLPLSDLMRAMASDKKVKGGRLRFVVLEELGRAVTREAVEASLIHQIWRELGAV